MTRWSPNTYLVCPYTFALLINYGQMKFIYIFVLSLSCLQEYCYMHYIWIFRGLSKIQELNEKVKLQFFVYFMPFTTISSIITRLISSVVSCVKLKIKSLVEKRVWLKSILRLTNICYRNKFTEAWYWLIYILYARYYYQRSSTFSCRVHYTIQYGYLIRLNILFCTL